MLSAVVVPVEPVGQVFGKLSASFVGSQVDPFVFQGAPEPFDEDVVFETALAVHADLDVPLIQHGGECFTGELATLVAVENIRGTVL